MALPLALALATGTLATRGGSNPTHGASVEAARQASIGAAVARAVLDGAVPTSPWRDDESANGPVGAGDADDIAPSPKPPVAAYRAPRLIYHGSRHRPVVALTFDDGWSADNARTVLAILRREHVTATFFVNAIWALRYPDIWRQIADAGYVVGNHTFRHHDATAMTPSELIRDLQRNARVWQEVTGHTMAPLFRPPYGYRDAATDLAAAKAGYPDVIMWDAVADDTYHLSDREVLRHATAGRAGSIVLMHIGPDVTPRILERVIANYRGRGFGFVTVPEILPRYVPPPVPATPAPPRPEPPAAQPLVDEPLELTRQPES
jgi:peptidoglycan-N-acetylglucosamine deacetylase